MTCESGEGAGTVINGLPATVPTAVVDLQSLDLDGISHDGELIRIGATTTLQQIVDDPNTPELLRHLAHREAPNTIRNAATIGGAVASAHPESGLVAGLLAIGAEVTLVEPAGEKSIGIEEVLSDRSALEGGIITSLSVPSGGRGASEATARTPADTPIVLVAGYLATSGEKRFAATGVGSTPLLAEVDSLDPPADFRGSGEYRKHLVATLRARVDARLEAAS